MKNLQTPWRVGHNALTVVNANGLVILNGSDTSILAHVVEVINRDTRVVHTEKPKYTAQKLEPGFVVTLEDDGRDVRLISHSHDGAHDNTTHEEWVVETLDGRFRAERFVPKLRKVGAA